MPLTAEDRATLRLFQELCGLNFEHLALLRAHNTDKLQLELTKFQNRLIEVNMFLENTKIKRRRTTTNDDDGPFLFGSQFTLAECNVAPFVQRCCTILPPYHKVKVNIDDSTTKSLSFHPIAICDDLGLDCLREWVNGVLSRPSVIATSPPIHELEDKKIKFEKRLNRIASAKIAIKGTTTNKKGRKGS